jgi:uncharacterized protein
LKGFDIREIGRIFLIYSGAIIAGLVTSELNVPLPWMIGPMVFATAAGLLGFSIRVPAVTRPVGQTIVAATVGLAFTPVAVAALAEWIVPMVAVAILTVVAGFLVAAILMRLTNIDVISACLATIPIGPVETANLAVRHGVAPGPVAFAQTSRIMILILIIPPVIVALDGSVSDPTAILANAEVDLMGALLLILAAAAGGVVLKKLKFANPFFLGPLAGSAAAAALTLPISAFPFVVLAGAQVLLGVWLGAMFDRDLFVRTRSFVPAALISTVLLIIACVLMALGVSAVTGIRWTTMVLSTAPGSVTEMALTAKILQEGVALVTAFHLTRIFIIMPAAPLIFSVTARVAARYGWLPPTRATVSDPVPPRD